MTTPHQTAARGADAARVLESEAFKESMASLKTAVIAQWKDCPIRDREGALLLLQLAKLTDKFETILVGMVETGKHAQHRIDLDSLRDEAPARQFFRRVTG